MLRVIKIGGHELDHAGYIARLARALDEIETDVVLVHGGGRALDELQARLSIETVKIDGLRRTDAATLEAALMAFCGVVNKRLVAGLRGHGVDAFGISGADGGVLACVKFEHPGGDLGFVGRVENVRAGVLQGLLANGLLPVLAPLALDAVGQIYNVNADEVACAVAAALGAAQLDYVSNVPGVIVDGGVLERLDPADVEAVIAAGAVRGGMVPKVRAALKALGSGVRKVRIVDLDGLSRRGGTTLVASQRQSETSIEVRS